MIKYQKFIRRYKTHHFKVFVVVVVVKLKDNLMKLGIELVSRRFFSSEPSYEMKERNSLCAVGDCSTRRWDGVAWALNLGRLLTEKQRREFRETDGHIERAYKTER